ncbi:MAG: hypothetical protein ACLTSG_08555 [Lachnospiraceae bacterium]
MKNFAFSSSATVYGDPASRCPSARTSRPGGTTNSSGDDEAVH